MQKNIETNLKLDLPINQILHGHVIEQLKKLPDKSVNCIVTSPPYWSLRAYQTKPVVWAGDENCEHVWQARDFKLHSGRGDAQKSGKYSEQAPVADTGLNDATCTKCNGWLGELGLEPHFKDYVKHLADIFDECKRVLRDDGTCWIVMGDTYSADRTYQVDGTKQVTGSQPKHRGTNSKELGVPPKSLCMIPHRFAIEMIDRGWTLRNQIVWHKGNCIPSSAKDRFTVDFECIFFFTKNAKYFFETQYEPYQTGSIERAMRGNSDKHKLVNGVPGQSAHSFHKPRPNITQTFANYVNTEYTGQATKDYDSVSAQNPSDTKRRILASMKKNLVFHGGGDYSSSTNHPYPNTKEHTGANTGVNNKEPYMENNPHRARLETPGGYDRMPPIGGVKRAGGQNPTYSGNRPEWKVRKDFDSSMAGGGTSFRGHSGYLKSDGTPISESVFGRIKRAVWKINTRGFSGGHFAVFCPQLIETPIRAGCPQFVCSKCGKPASHQYKEWRENTRPGTDVGNKKSGTQADPNKGLHKSDLSKYRQQIYRVPDGLLSCDCNAEMAPGICLDPFFGTGTTGEVALKQGKRFIGCELNPDYIKLAEKRLAPLMPKVQEVNNWHP